MKKISVLFLAALVLAPLITKADGGFVTEKFVWDKHKDINEPTQKAIIVYDAGHEDLILQVKYEGPVDHFGWLIPVPNLPRVQRGSMKCFYELSQYTQERFAGGEPNTLSASQGLDGNHAPPPPPPVKVIETKTVGAYEIAVLSAEHSDALRKWLDDNEFYLPPARFDVVDSYIQRKWYFVAVKINLASGHSNLRSASRKLASGELNPLQISFASDRCIFPLKISSINGKSSEVHVYVLSSKPLLELSMLQEHLPMFYTNDLARAAQSARWRKAETDRSIQICTSRFGGVPPDLDAQEIVQAWNGRPVPSPEELLPYARVTKNDLPECRRLIPALGGKSWWLAKHTWTFQPQDMRDLTFEPALPAFRAMLGSKYGYFAAAGLCSFGSDGLTVLLQAMRDPNNAVRADAASAFNNMNNWPNTYQIYRDPRLTNAAPTWLKDPDPGVRMAGLYLLNALNMMNALNHQGRTDAKITGLLTLVQDPDPVVRATAVLDAGAYQNYPLPEAVLVALLQNSEAYARMSGVTLLYRNAVQRHEDRQSVELALPMLKDPNRFVAELAGSTLRSITGQDFADDEAGKWNTWWNENKTHFIAQRRPEEFGLRPIIAR